MPATFAPTRIAIVGGGFTGAIVAVQLVRQLAHPATIVVIEPRATVGAGVAYSASDPAHRINVPAARMTVFPEDPTQFDRWLRQQDGLAADSTVFRADGAAFPQRRWFGRYVATLFEEASRARADISVRHRVALVQDIARTEAWRLSLSDGGTIEADILVLAATHPPPAPPAALADLSGSGVVSDPWAPGALAAIRPDDRVLIIGTGLSMADVVASLDHQGGHGAVVAVSRRGLLSRGHAPGDAPAHDGFGACAAPSSARALSRAIRQQVAAAARAGVPWQSVFEDVRAQAGRLWAALPLDERRRLLRHLRPFWDVHRFRAAPQTEAAMARMRQSGRLRVWAASVTAARRSGGGFTIDLQHRGGRHEELDVDAIVVTTGPAHQAALRTNPALAALARQGLLRGDPVGLGIEVDAQMRPLGVDGTASPSLFVAGPLARGRVGELMGLPQVSTHAAAVAAEVAALARTAPRH